MNDEKRYKTTSEKGIDERASRAKEGSQVSLLSSSPSLPPFPIFLSLFFSSSHFSLVVKGVRWDTVSNLPFMTSALRQEADPKSVVLLPDPYVAWIGGY